MRFFNTIRKMSNADRMSSSLLDLDFNALMMSLLPTLRFSNWENKLKITGSDFGSCFCPKTQLIK